MTPEQKLREHRELIEQCNKEIRANYRKREELRRMFPWEELALIYQQYKRR